MTRAFAVVCVLFLTFIGPASATPSVSSVTGDTSQDGTLIIIGSGFGNTGHEVPIKFDDFESGTVGASLAAGGWSVTNDNGPPVPVYSSVRSWSGAKSGYADMTMGGDSAAYLSGLGAKTIYASFMFYYTTNGNPDTHKFFRVNANDGPSLYTSYPNIMPQDFANDTFRITVCPQEDVGGKFWASYPGEIPASSWQRTEFWFKISDPAGSSNGEIRYWRNLNQLTNWSGVNRTSGVSSVWEMAMMPFYFGNGGGGEIWYDDVYLSYSKARVEIGNASTWSGCTIREIQGVTSWSDSSVTLTTNQGSFANGSGAYLYVVDANGSVNAAGYPITIGGPVLYDLSVTNGSGDGQYEAGAVVAISADSAPSGKAFGIWVGDSSSVADTHAASTTVTMPSADVSLTAGYIWVYQLTVNSGAGDGSYTVGTVVDISADPAPSGQAFDQWTGDTAGIANVADTLAATTTITMPPAAVEVTATYKAVTIPGDLNGDGFVGQGDLDIVLDQWGCGDPPADPITDSRADPSGDGFVGQTDLDIVLDHWGEGL